VNEDGEKWARAELLSRGITPGETTWVKIRPWSHVAQITSDRGDFWFKASLGDTAYEPALIRLLGTLAPAHIVVPLAVETGQGWSLSPHGGEILRDAHSDFDVAAWERMLREYGRLQRDLTPHVPDLLAAGTPDQRPQTMPGHLSALLDRHDNPAVRAAEPTIAQACEELAAAPIEPTLQHDDLHDGNVLVEDDRFAFFDWGDASVAHPFGTLLVTLRVAASKTGVQAGDPLLARLRRAYLEPWTDEHSIADLERWAFLAMQTAKVGRALSWQRALVNANEAELQEWGDAVSGWLEEITGPDVW
jgi:hypothetical protein